MFDLQTASPPACPEAPAFIRRSKHRNSRSRATSEKLGRVLEWTTGDQGSIGTLLEVTHGVVSYGFWPRPVTVRSGWESPHKYWPAMELRTESGQTTFVDVVQPQDEAERARLDFEHVLGDALGKEGIGLLTISSIQVMADPKLRIAKEVRRYTCSPLSDDNLGSELSDLMDAGGGTVPLGTLQTAGPRGGLLVARACVLIMRRALRLSIHPEGLMTSTVHAVRPGAPT